MNKRPIEFEAARLSVPGMAGALAALILTALLVSGPTPRASAQAASSPYENVGMLDASEPKRIARFMEEAGYIARLGADADKRPLISGRLGRSDYTIQFYECERGLFCNSVQFLTAVPAPETVTLETVNAFNAQWRYVRVSLANDEVRLQMDVNLDAGVTTDNFRDTLDIWRQLLALFETDLLGLPPLD